jgi:hypothetical protein
MSATPVSPVNGKYTIRGKDARVIELTLDDRDLQNYVVEELAGDDLTAKLPPATPDNTNWFAGFSVYNGQNGQKLGYATVQYSFTVPLEKGQKLYVAYGGRAYDVTKEMQDSGKVTLRQGDPGVGSAP